MKRAARAVLVLGLAGTLALLLVEGLLRLVPVPAVEVHRRAGARAESPNFFAYDPGLGWRGRPGMHGVMTGWELSHDVRLNAHGFRDGERGPKPPDRFRIVLLGDSITWGHGVEPSERYGERLGEALRRLGVAVEVVNLAVSGYGTDQELLLWEGEGRRYCADLVLLGLYGNDVRENMLAFQGRHPKPYFLVSSDGTLALHGVPVARVPDALVTPSRGPRAWLQRHARVWATLAFVRQALRGPAASATTAPEAPAGGVELTAALISRLAASVRRDDSPFAVIVLPDVHDAPATREAAARSGVAAILDLAPSFRQAPDGARPLFYRLDGAHWTASAHALAAEKIARWIPAAKLLAPSPRACPERP